VIHAEALSWLQANPARPGTSVVTSLPDVSELSPYDFEAWRAWFVLSATRVLEWLPPDGVAIFFQSDVHHGGVWVDKAHLILRAADDTGASLLWHKIACRHPAGTVALGRPAYSHLLCLARAAPGAPARFGPDVLPECGFKPYSKAMGVAACELACRFLRAATQTTLVVDPFCGHGTLLAVANALGFDALGVDRSTRSCRAARKLTIALEEEDTAASP
jgi:diadenosine tetraphosphate (Ap4A) HIT family hydrolase